MTIKEVEEQTGLTRSNIRFYEKEKLIEPSRSDKNGYRDYSEKDIEIIKKIAYLRTLEISIEDIRCIISEKVSLIEIIEKQIATIQEQIEGLNKAKIMCARMLEAGNISFDELQVEMSVQWSNGIETSFVDKKFILVYPLACIIIRVLLRPIIYVRLLMNYLYGELIAEYLSNYICFVALSVEIFSILFVYGLVKNVVTVLLIDTVALIGMLIIGIVKMGFLRRPESTT